MRVTGDRELLYIYICVGWMLRVLKIWVSVNWKWKIRTSRTSLFSLSATPTPFPHTSRILSIFWPYEHIEVMYPVPISILFEVLSTLSPCVSKWRWCRSSFCFFEILKSETKKKRSSHRDFWLIKYYWRETTSFSHLVLRTEKAFYALFLV